MHVNVGPGSPALLKEAKIKSSGCDGGHRVIDYCVGVTLNLFNILKSEDRLGLCFEVQSLIGLEIQLLQTLRQLSISDYLSALEISVQVDARVSWGRERLHDLANDSEALLSLVILIS